MRIAYYVYHIDEFSVDFWVPVFVIRESAKLMIYLLKLPPSYPIITFLAKVARLKLKAVRNLEANERVTARIAKAAVEVEGYADHDKCVEWILLNEFEDDLIDQLNTDFERSCQGM